MLFYRHLFILLITIFTLVSCSLSKPLPEPQGEPLRKIIDNEHFDNLYIGATTGFKDWDTPVDQILNREFSYISPNNDFKQSRIHPTFGVWNWDVSDEWVARAKQNNQVIRLHGPISPQSSKWVLRDNRTPAELEKMLVEFMTAISQRYNDDEHVVWIDVVNETITEEGTWFGPKPGVKNWENPWPKMGFETDIPEQFPLLQEQGVPLYIIKAFEVAQQHGPNKKLVLNQHRMTTPESIALVKELVLYLKYRGLRVDALGWQAHIKKEFADFANPNSKALQTLDGLIKWAHSQDIEFHVTEKNIHQPKNKVYSEQDIADVYTNILQTLLQNRKTGIVAWNLWNVVDDPDFSKRSISRNTKRLGLWNVDLEPNMAYENIRKLLLDDARANQP
ncbi:endo-1,4-beta-xylanase [Thalassomonas sp. M1454]|uniref:endo-1,4-beta-xylanase n=1 Tax=Thalassomonas sp. M1454 TaxID=2594477 RepID=UPI00163DB211|nr:endo-1,4-beta-xylanase [Thalassomonas sp. M1454]